MDISVTMVFFWGVNLSDAHLDNQHTEITFSANCLVGVVNAHSSFHLSVQRSQNFLVVDRDSAKWFEKQFVAFKKRSKLSSKNSSRKHVFGTSRGTVFEYFLTKTGFQNGTPFWVSGY
jgi:hypothetical protein